MSNAEQFLLSNRVYNARDILIPVQRPVQRLKARLNVYSRAAPIFLPKRYYRLERT